MRTLVRIFQSALGAVAVSATVWMTVFFAQSWVILHRMRKEHGLGAVAAGPHFMYSGVDFLDWALLVCSFVVVVVMLRRSQPLALVGGVFSFWAAWLLLVALILLFLFKEGTVHTIPLKDAARMTVVTATCFAGGAFYAGVIGGWWLGLRQLRIRSMQRLLVESAIAGVVLGIFVPLCYFLYLRSIESSASTGQGSSVAIATLIVSVFSASVGVLIASLFAVVFRRRLVASNENREVTS